MKAKWVNKIKTINGFLIVLLCFFLILAITSIVQFILIFYRSSLSNNINDWSSYSSFTSGILSPIFSVANILIIIYVAKVVNSWEEKREKLTKDKESKSADYKLKLQAYREFTAYFEQFNSFLSNIFENYTKSKLLILATKRLQLELLIDLYEHQFNSLTTAESKDDMNRISTILKTLSSTSINNCFNEKLTEEDRTASLEELRLNTEDFYKRFYTILNRLKKELVTIYNDIEPITTTSSAIQDVSEVHLKV